MQVCRGFLVTTLLRRLRPKTPRMSECLGQGTSAKRSSPWSMAESGEDVSVENGAGLAALNRFPSAIILIKCAIDISTLSLTR
jgi:hypothetical protein